MPDMQAGSGCATGCGTSTTFGNYTSVTSHELTEAMTDAFVGIATVFGPPLAWYDMTNGEIGDICNAQQGSYVANGTTYTIQLEFSNSANNCVNFPVSVDGPNFSLSASPSSLTVTQGSSGNQHDYRDSERRLYRKRIVFNIGAAERRDRQLWHQSDNWNQRGDFYGQLNRNHRNLASVTITGTSGTLTHTTSISLTINATATPNFSLSASPSSVSVTQGSSGNQHDHRNSDVGGFTGSVTLSNSALPSGVTASFGTNPTTSTSVLDFHRQQHRNHRNLHSHDHRHFRNADSYHHHQSDHQSCRRHDEPDRQRRI